MIDPITVYTDNDAISHYILHPIRYYTTNPTECLAAATECSASESDLESSVESHRAMAEQVCRALSECSLGFYR